MSTELDDLEVDFDRAFEKLANDVAEQVELETAGMDDLQRADYFLARAREHLVLIRQIDGPDFLIERAERIVAEREAKRAALGAS